MLRLFLVRQAFRSVLFWGMRKYKVNKRQTGKHQYAFGWAVTGSH